MTISTVRDTATVEARELMADLLAPDPPAFALLCRSTGAAPAAGESTMEESTVELVAGEAVELTALADLPLPAAGTAAGEVLAVVPFRQITERGYACHDDGAPILALTADRRAGLPVPDALELLPDVEVSVSGGGFDLPDDEYARVVRRIVDGEIRAGEGSNFVIRRTFTATLDGYRPAVAMTIFRRLLTAESNAYWTFLVHTGDRTFVGASPEQHVRSSGGVVRMNPISGTYRYPPSGADPRGVLDFLADQKEIDELYMVVDEELKMLAGVCRGGARVRGPYLREMARLAHTEYVLEGPCARDAREVLRETMFAPTVVGSPLENACRVIARHEAGGRGYYAGALALLGRDASGSSTVDSAILIRTAEIHRDGALRIDVGATLVRDSRPAAEVAETWAKVDALLAATGVRAPNGPAGRRRTGPDGSGSTRAPLGGRADVAAALRRRNAGLSAFWLASPDPPEPDPAVPGSAVPGSAVPDVAVPDVAVPDRPASNRPVPGRVLIVDAEDMFTRMLGHQVRALGAEVALRPWSAVAPDDVAAADCVLLGPGPGDPRAGGDPRIAALRGFVERLLDARVPFVAECLSHQVLCAVLGLPLVARNRPNQGTRHRIDLFGTPELVGFYNSYAARHDADRLTAAPGSVEVCRDTRTGEVHAVRGPGFASAQFHLESVLTERGAEILAGLVAWAAGTGEER
ncbi:phenazine biosynthesis protein phzE [Amycolatopsis arida]|uniref:anthranilate synthase n=1 Tax=Amycolatopsis arida TaxID=587909 RepID=A0A1I5V608_9PSEU|nr:anthranilate synthase family protein [Amycolatopsis arida]TDX91160.1 phenazine biosynthesis protein phzE [Amycolatopsis arida]SFQ02822.1 phenazine biosynthesis protein phzE [Amycolatopsis arida]